MGRICWPVHLFERSAAHHQFTQRDMGDYPEAYAENLEAAEEIVDLCEEQGIRVVFFVVPNSNPPETEDLARIEEDLTLWEANSGLQPDLRSAFYRPGHGLF